MNEQEKKEFKERVAQKLKEKKEKEYQLCLKLRKLIDENFGIESACDYFTSTLQDGGHKRARIVTKEGLIIEWVGNYFTDDERAEFERDHLEGDIDPEESEKNDEVLSSETDVHS